MGSLYKKLTLKNVGLGWPVFWRLHLPLWITLGHVVLSVIVVDLLQPTPPFQSAARRLGVMAPGVQTAVGILVMLLLLWLPARFARRQLARRAGTEFWRAQFALVGRLARFSHGVAVLLAAMGVALIWGWEEWRTVPAALRWIAGGTAALLLSVLGLSIALFGWLAEQWKELEDRP